ncbi:MAG TPA: carbohydrate-binding protein, partial [Methanoregulaceae archaeon]|nr:carbohydrate-binding protein [Methanoregulaceae archaeon]
MLIGLVGAVAAADQTAFNGPHTIPGRIQAEDYDNGGAGIAYSDTTSGNSGGAGRTTEAVDVETVNGVTNIGWVIDGEWTEYTVSVGAPGSYTANFRIGSWANSRQVVLTVDGATGCTITVPNTGSYEAFQTVSAPLVLSAGTHVIRLTCLGSGQNIDWFEIAAGATTVPVTNPTVVPTQVAGQTPYNGVHTLPGRVQAEDFDNGGQNVAYYDTTSGNSGGAGRTAEAVDVETVNGVTNIGWIIAGEWTEYTVNVATSGSYTANFRVGSWANSRQVVLTVDGATGCTITVPNTGSSEAYQTVSAPLSLTAGTHVIRLTYLVSGQNIDWFEITGGATTIVPTTAPTS